MQRLLTLAALLGLLHLPAGAAHAGQGAGEWEPLADQDGIQVWQREVADSPLVEFRGVGPVKAPLLKVAAIIRNSKKKPEWLGQCAEERALHLFSPAHAVVYNRIKSPNFLVSDRDVVLEAKALVFPERKTVRIDFKNITDAGAPPQPDAVRMPRTIGFWELTWLDPSTTRVTYQVQADPGGALPAWLVNWASKRLPLNALLGLRGQADAPGYDQDLMVLEAAYDWSAFDPAPTEPVLPDEQGSQLPGSIP